MSNEQMAAQVFAKDPMSMEELRHALEYSNDVAETRVDLYESDEPISAGKLFD
jgi:hypothetical protein